MATATSNGTTVAKAKEAGGTVASTAKSASRPALTAGAAAAGLAGGLVIGSRLRLRRKSGLQQTLELLGKAAKELGSATKQAASTTNDIRQVREELEKANRQSPVEVLLDALTHRRGAHRRER